jgi:hypothetical protein
MAHGRARDERKERQWRRWIGEWQASGLSVLQRRAAEKATTFVPVQVVTDTVPARTRALELVLTDGRTVRVAPGLDAATLRQLLAVLEGRPC